MGIYIHAVEGIGLAQKLQQIMHALTRFQRCTFLLSQCVVIKLLLPMEYIINELTSMR